MFDIVVCDSISRLSLPFSFHSQELAKQEIIINLCDNGPFDLSSNDALDNELKDLLSPKQAITYTRDK